jgi:hypothetical protein
MDRPTFYASLTEFIRELHPDEPVGDISPTLNLFNAGLIESFFLPQLVQRVEQVLSHPLNLRRLTMECFYTMERMYDSFVTE